MKKILIILSLMNVIFVQAQVGINIVPLSTEAFHVDAAKNNATGLPGIIYLDDIVVDAGGNMGIGTNVPQAKLDVKTTEKGKVFRLVDGNEQIGRALITNGNGVARWGDVLNVVDYVSCPVNMDGIQPQLYNHTGEYSGRSLTLTKGSWFIKYSINWTFDISSVNDVGFIDTFLCRNTTGTPDKVDGTWVITPMFKNAQYASTQIGIIYTVTASSETLYLWTYHNQVTHSILSTGGYNTFEAIRWL